MKFRCKKRFKFLHGSSAFFLSLLLLVETVGLGNEPERMANSRVQALGVLCNKKNQRREILLERAGEIGLPAYLIYHNSVICLEAETITNVGVLFEGRVVLSSVSHPIPTVVYRFNFISTRPAKAESYKKINQILSVRQVRFINPDSAHQLTRNKFRFSKALDRQGLSHPETKEFSHKNLIKLLEKHTAVFVKPVFGNHGKGIVVVRKNSAAPRRYDLAYSVLGPESLYFKCDRRGLEISEIPQLTEQAMVEMGTYESRYIVQEGVDVHIFNGKVSEVRALTVRGKDGDLASPILVAKIGGNRCSGGYIDDFGVLSSSIAKQLGISKSSIENAVKRCASELHLAIEEEIGEKCGDLGHDIAIDAKGNVEIIESNVKSGQFVGVTDSGICCDKKLFGSMSWIVYALDLQGIRDRAIADYALYLSDF